MAEKRASLRPIAGAPRPQRQRLNLRGELLLALLPTLVVLSVLLFVEAFSHQRLLFASLASSAFLIYLDPDHGANTVRSLVAGHLIATVAGVSIYFLLGPGYVAGGSAMIITIITMILTDSVHPPAVSTALSFAFRDESQRTIWLFVMALALVAVLVMLQRSALWLVTRTRGTTE